MRQANDVDAQEPTLVFYNPQSRKVLDVAGASAQNGGNILSWPSHGGDNQLWKIGLEQQIINVRSQKAMDVDGMNKENGANVIQWDYWGGWNQKWQFNK